MTMNDYWAAIIAVSCVFLVHVLYGIDTNAESAAQEGFLIGPDGVTFCRLDNHPYYAGMSSFMHPDKNGECACPLCHEGQHLKAFCECEEGSSLLKIPTDCGTVEIGQFMNQSNFCATPFNCTPSCPENQTLKVNCTLSADIQCQCKDGWFNPNKKDTGSIPQECRQKPSCPNAGEEPLANDGTNDDTRTFSCQTCRDGNFKEEGDGECKPHQICQRKAGNEFEDNQCLHDAPNISPPTQDPAIDEATKASTTQDVSQPTAPMPGDHETTDPAIDEATIASTTQDVSQTTAPIPGDHETTDPGTEGDACSCVVPWSFSLIGWIVVFFCIVFCIYQQTKLKEQKDRQAQVARNTPVNNNEEEYTLVIRDSPK